MTGGEPRGPGGSGVPGGSRVCDTPAAAWCEHGSCAHDPAAYGSGGLSSAGTAPVNARAWLLIEHDGPWAAEAVETALPADLAKLAIGADERGIRVQLIRRPGRPGRPGTPALAGGDAGPAVFAGWTVDPEPWLRRVPARDFDHTALELLAEGKAPGGVALEGPLYLVCAHGRRDRCCARFGVPLARDLAARYPEEAWETTHVGGHRFAGNLVILPHGLYYGPVDSAGALDAAGAYARGEISGRGYRGRAAWTGTGEP